MATKAPVVQTVVGSVLTFDDGQIVNRATLPPASAKYQSVVDELVSLNPGRFTYSRNELIAAIIALRHGGVAPTDGVHMKSIRWMTNAQNRYRPLGPRTDYILPFSTAEIATNPTPSA